jgi:hypothetical protein
MQTMNPTANSTSQDFINRMKAAAVEMQTNGGIVCRDGNEKMLTSTFIPQALGTALEAEILYIRDSVLTYVKDNLVRDLIRKDLENANMALSTYRRSDMVDAWLALKEWS